jgi:hypothetical protein
MAKTSSFDPLFLARQHGGSQIYGAADKIEDGVIHSQIFAPDESSDRRIRLDNLRVQVHDRRAPISEFVIADAQGRKPDQLNRARRTKAFGNKARRRGFQLCAFHKIEVQRSYVTAGVDDELAGDTIERTGSIKVRILQEKRHRPEALMRENGFDF